MALFLAADIHDRYQRGIISFDMKGPTFVSLVLMFFPIPQTPCSLLTLCIPVYGLLCLVIVQIQAG